MTTKDNLDGHLSQIRWETLPATFQDAILVTRGLGLDYIWIDSLCIVQDDSADWMQEAGTMKDIYTNSYLTIAALIAPNAHYGLFRNPKPVNPPGELQAANLKGAPFSIYTRRYNHSDFSPHYHPLMNRAWTFQELILSPRVLFFRKL